jgi:excinuclease ABC subunit A
LRRLRDAGNTVVVVEHDPAAMAEADHMIELGPAGPLSGVVTAKTLTGEYLAGSKRISVPSSRRRVGPQWLTVKGATLHNLKGVRGSMRRFPWGHLLW